MPQEYIRQFRNISPELVPSDYPLLENFEDTLFKWTFVKINASATGARDTTQANRGGASCKISTGAAGANVDDEAYIIRTIGIPKTYRTSCSAWFKMGGMYDNYEIWLDGFLRNPSAAFFYTVGLKLKRTAVATEYYYRESGASWVKFATTADMFDDASWYKMEIVVDLEKEEYAYAVIAGKRHYLTGIKLEKAVAPDVGAETFMFYLITKAAAVKIIYVDDIIIGPEV